MIIKRNPSTANPLELGWFQALASKSGAADRRSFRGTELPVSQTSPEVL
jgi:hypothetical protein